MLILCFRVRLRALKKSKAFRALHTWTRQDWEGRQDCCTIGSDTRVLLAESTNVNVHSELHMKRVSG